LSDLALGVVVFTFIAVPASLLLLALADGIGLEGDGQRKRWIRVCLWALTLPTSIPLGIAAWGWAGAAHLEPLCQAYASPEFRNERSIFASSLVIESDQSQAGEVPPAWATVVVEQLQAPRGPLGEIRISSQSSDRSVITPSSSGHALRLQVRRLLHHENLWFRVEMDRFRLYDANDRVTLALADELWIDAGRARYHCGIVSGRNPKTGSGYPAGDGVARFVERAIAGTTRRR